MSKRPRDSTSSLTSPHLKHARMESPLETEREQALRDAHANLSTLITKKNHILHIYYQLHQINLDNKVLTCIKNQPLLTVDQVQINAESVNQEQFLEILRKAAKSPLDHEAVETLIFHDVFWTPPPGSEFNLPSRPLKTTLIREPQSVATEDSWTGEFINQSPLYGLIDHVRRQLLQANLYARYCAIVQSSGMGKSRLLDEFSREFFMIPINLRSADTRGFPPPDHVVRDYLTKGDSAPDEVLYRIRRFLLALFKQTADKITSLGNCPSDRIENFRNFMSKNQHMGSAGTDRVDFYKSVISLAKGTQDPTKTHSSLPPPDDSELLNGLEMLRQALNSNAPGSNDCVRNNFCIGDSDLKFVDVFIAFDEAITLTNAITDVNERHPEPESYFVVLRRTLGYLKLSPLYTFFLSTTGSIMQFAKPRGEDSSNRIFSGDCKMPRPYIYLGFDQLMQNRKVFQRWKTLEDVTSLECAAHMGRPLWGSRYDHGNEYVRQSLVGFAEEKLLCKSSDPKPLSDSTPLSNAEMHAILSQRLALDIHTPQYLFSASPDNAKMMMNSMHAQIANHMRVCVAVDENFGSLRGIASSEPILSEAASNIMLNKAYEFKLHDALSRVLAGYCVSQGERGELIVAAFFAWARDRVVKLEGQPPAGQLCIYFSVYALFKQLFRGSSILDEGGPSIYHSDSGPKKPFKDVFKDANMHFNHLIKPDDQKCLRRSKLLAFMARGAAALGANCQPGFDAVYPYLYGGTSLDVKKVGFIIVQVRNNSTSYTNTSLDEVFSAMDPFACKLISDTDEEDGQFPIPIIRIVFLLSGNGASFRQHQYAPRAEQAPKRARNRASKQARKKAPKQAPECEKRLFTSYDYVCAGVDPAFLGPVEESTHESWKTLVNKRDRWQKFYEVPEGEILRSQIPGGGSDVGHYKNWLEEVSCQE